MGWREAAGALLLVATIAGCSSDDASTAASTAAPATTTTTTMASLAPPSADEVRDVLRTWLHTTDAPGAVAAVQVGTGEPVIVAVGVDAKTGAPLAPDVPFAIASNTKTFVGALILDLVDEGALGLDDTVAQYVPDFPNLDRITVRELLSHTSGLSAQGDDGNPPQPYAEEFRNLVLQNLDRTFTVDEMLAMVRDRPLEFEPGTGVQYSNVNTILLGRIVEAVTGTDLTTALRTRLLDPVGLSHTYYAATEEGAAPTPGLFTLADGGPVLNSADFPHTGILTAIGAAGAMVSTVPDMVRWADAFLREGALGKTDLAESRFQVAANGTGLGVIGWTPGIGGCTYIEGCPPGTPSLAVIGSGSIPGTNSVVSYFPELDVTIVAFASSSLVDVQAELVGLLLDRVAG